MTQREKFFGVWSLDDWTIAYPDGKMTRPFGETPFGYITYDPCGVMTATVSRAARSRLDCANARAASEGQRADAFNSYFHYAGEWRVDGDTVVHTVKAALNPDMVGTEQRREAIFGKDESTLALAADEPMRTGGARRHVLAWRKIEKDEAD